MAAEPYKSARKITPGSPLSVPYGRGVLVACRTEGVLTLVMQDGSLLETYVYQGTSQLDGFAVADVSAANTTAVCTVSSLS